MEYFARRAGEERHAAKVACDIRAAHAHIHLAERYEGVVAAYAPILQRKRAATA